MKLMFKLIIIFTLIIYITTACAISNTNDSDKLFDELKTNEEATKFNESEPKEKLVKFSKKVNGNLIGEYEGIQWGYDTYWKIESGSLFLNLDYIHEVRRELILPKSSILKSISVKLYEEASATLRITSEGNKEFFTNLSTDLVKYELDWEKPVDKINIYLKSDGKYGVSNIEIKEISYVYFLLDEYTNDHDKIKSVEPFTISTYESIGVYWQPEDASPDKVCKVKFKPVGEKEWIEALDIKYNERVSLLDGAVYRGSIVNLKPGTNYDIHLSLYPQGSSVFLQSKTWDENYQIGKTILIDNPNETIRITEGGTKDNYILYQPVNPEIIFDVNRKYDYNMIIDAPYVIIRGFNLKNAIIHGIVLDINSHNVVIEDCEISGWGRVAKDGWGVMYDSAIYSKSENLEKITIQRNKLYNPFSNSNNWNEKRSVYNNSTHPQGPQAITFFYGKGNHVIRWNEIFSTNGNYFNDGIGGGENDGFAGAPNKDSDIYENYITHCWDDAIEAEGANRNVRIWRNYINDVATGIALAPSAIGPVYVWSNIIEKTKWSHEDKDGGRMIKLGNAGDTSTNGGYIYLFHNTLFSTIENATGDGINNPPAVNVTTRNNIILVKNKNSVCLSAGAGSKNYDYDYDLYNGIVPANSQKNGIFGVPRFSGKGLDPKTLEGNFYLDDNSLGANSGIYINNFSDVNSNKRPDMGAHQRYTSSMKFGINARR